MSSVVCAEFGGNVFSSALDDFSDIESCVSNLFLRDSRHCAALVRRPALYSMLGQDTLETYTLGQFGLPPAGVFTAAAVDPGATLSPWDAAVASAERALAAAKAARQTLRLIVYPANLFSAPEIAGMDRLKALARQENVDLLVHFGALVPPQSVLVTPAGTTYAYARTHRARDEQIPDAKLSDFFWVVDRDYARLALMRDKDLFAPETAVVLAKMGVDVVAVNADTAASVLSALWKSRTGASILLSRTSRARRASTWAATRPRARSSCRSTPSTSGQKRSRASSISASCSCPAARITAESTSHPARSSSFAEPICFGEPGVLGPSLSPPESRNHSGSSWTSWATRIPGCRSGTPTRPTRQSETP